MAKNKRKAIEKVVRKAYGDFEYSNPFILNKKSCFGGKIVKLKNGANPYTWSHFMGQHITEKVSSECAETYGEYYETPFNTQIEDLYGNVLFDMNDEKHAVLVSIDCIHGNNLILRIGNLGCKYPFDSIDTVQSHYRYNNDDKKLELVSSFQTTDRCMTDFNSCGISIVSDSTIKKKYLYSLAQCERISPKFDDIKLLKNDIFRYQESITSSENTVSTTFTGFIDKNGNLGPTFFDDSINEPVLLSGNNNDERELSYQKKKKEKKENLDLTESILKDDDFKLIKSKKRPDII